jgi:hypothetical protein
MVGSLSALTQRRAGLSYCRPFERKCPAARPGLRPLFMPPIAAWHRRRRRTVTGEPVDPASQWIACVPCDRYRQAETALAGSGSAATRARSAAWPRHRYGLLIRLEQSPQRKPCSPPIRPRPAIREPCISCDSKSLGARVNGETFNSAILVMPTRQQPARSLWIDCDIDALLLGAEPF